MPFYRRHIRIYNKALYVWNDFINSYHCDVIFHLFTSEKHKRQTVSSYLNICFLVYFTDDGTKYNYDEVLHKSILFYAAQRSGKLPVDNPIP